MNEYELIYLAQENDEEAKEELYQNYKGLLEKNAKKFLRLNKNNGITYEYKPIEHKKEKKVSKKKEETITSQAIELFGDDMIAVN